MELDNGKEYDSMEKIEKQSNPSVMNLWQRRVNVKIVLALMYLHKKFKIVKQVLILFTQPLRLSRIWHKVNFLAEFYRFWIQSFPSPRLVASPRLKNSVCPTIYP